MKAGTRSSAFFAGDEVEAVAGGGSSTAFDAASPGLVEDEGSSAGGFELDVGASGAEGCSGSASLGLDLDSASSTKGRRSRFRFFS